MSERLNVDYRVSWPVGRRRRECVWAVSSSMLRPGDIYVIMEGASKTKNNMKYLVHHPFTDAAYGTQSRLKATKL